MKCISVFVLCAAVSFAQTSSFTNGQAARLVIGQSTFTSQDTSSSDTVLGAVGGIAYAADTLFVADANRVGATPANHRVLMFSGLSSMLPAPTAEIAYTKKCPVCTGQASVVLGQPNFTTTTETIPATRTSLRLPTAVASDGVHLVVADTNHNRVVIWNRIPTSNNQPADVVVGQPDFTTASIPPNNTPTAKSMRGPQGVWIQNGKLYVADTQNNRVLIYNSIPTSNGVAADVVLGAPDFTTFVQPDLTQQTTSATASNLLNPVAVSSDGTHLFVTDLGYNRVLIWNSIPTRNAAAADVVLGQPNMNTSVPNNAFSLDPNDTTFKETPVLCTVSNGTDPNNNLTYPSVCNATLNFPRFALAGGGRLFVADGGNDRVLVYNQIPTQNSASADVIIGQIGGSINQASDAADSLRTPMSMAWDGTNLYVSDAYNRRITVYTLATTILPYQAIRNSANLEIHATGKVTIGGTITNGDIVTITLGTFGNNTTTDYSYTVTTTDGLNTIVQGLVNSINNSNSGAGDPNVLASADQTTQQVVLTARTPGDQGNNVTYSTKVSTGATVALAAAGSSLSGGGDAAKIAPGTIVSIIAADAGHPFTDQTGSADPANGPLPTKLAGVQVYFNGIQSPLLLVSPTLINAQIPWEVNDTTSINAYVRAVRSDGRIVTTTPVAVTIIPANPGIFTQPGTDPPLGVVFHGSSKAIGIVSVDGTATANNTTTVTIEDRSYNYTVQSGDTLDTIRDNLVVLINQDPKVTAYAAGVFDRIVIQARIPGPEGDGIALAATASAGATVIMTAFTPTLCCSNVAGTPVTELNPAVPGEFVYLYATGLGQPVFTDANKGLVTTGVPYPASGPITQPASAVNAIAGGKTADVISATLAPGSVGLYLVVLHLNGDLPTDVYTQLTIAQDIYVSNIVRIRVTGFSQ